MAIADPKGLRSLGFDVCVCRRSGRGMGRDAGGGGEETAT